MNLNVVKKITIKGETQGVEQASASVNKLQQAYDRNARAMEMATRQMQQYERLERQSAQFRQASIDSINRLAAANDNLAGSLRAANDNSQKATASFHFTGIEAASTANHLKTAAIAAYALSPAFRSFANPLIATALKAIGPAAATAAGVVFSALSPLLAFISRIAIPIYAVIKAFQAMAAITELGAEKLKEFNEIAANAGKAGTSADFFQRQALAAKELKLNTDAATSALTKFNEASEPKLGGSTFQKRLDELASFGNFAGNAGVAAVKQAASLEERYRAAISLITTAIAQGERLAALDLAATFLPPAMLDRLRANGEALKDLQTTADKIKPADIIGVDQIGQAVDLKKRLEDANDVIEKRFAPIKKDLTQLGLNYQASWVATVELMATAVTHAAALYDWLKQVPGVLQKNALQDWFQTFNDWSDKMGLNAKPESMGIDVSGANADMEAATKRLAGLLKNQTEVQRAMRESTDVSVAVFGDKSIAALEKVQKATAATVSHYDTLLQRTKDRIGELELEARGAGRTADEVIKLKVAHDLERAAKSSNKEVTEEMRAEWQKLGEQMAKAVQTATMMREIKSNLTNLGSGFIKDLSKGVDLMDAIAKAAGNLGDMLIDIGTKRLTEMAVSSAASMFAPQAMIAGATTAAAILSGSGTVTGASVAVGGAEAGTSLAVGGTIAGTAINGPLVLLMAALVAVGATLSAWSGTSAKKKQEEEAQARAWEQWQAAGLQLASYFAKANGTSVGNIRTQLQEQQSEAERLLKLRSESQGFKNRAQEDADPIMREIHAAYGNFRKRLVDEFVTNFAPTIEAMKSGFGEDSPIFQAFQNIKSVGEKLQAFIADAEFIFGKGSGQAGEARGAAQQRALSLLQGESDPLSAVEKRMQEIQGTARGLQKVLEDLGMSSEEARRQIEDGVVRAIATLKKAFTEDLQRELNDLQGKGFLNEFFDLFKKNAERLKDNAALGGGNEDLIAKLFGLSAQGIVDRFKLTGESFQELIRKFPELSGVVKEFSELVTEAAKRSKEDIDSARLSIQDELFALTNDTSTVAGQLAAVEREFNRRRLEETKAGGELSNELEELYQKRRQQIIEDANAKALEEAKRAAEEQQRAINSAARSVAEYLQGLQSGQGSTLSPTQILANAQAAYNANLAIAQGNPNDQATLDAVNNFSKVADNLEKAARSVFGSATGYQDIRSQIIAQGLSLPTVLASTDPVVNSLLDVIAAIEAGTATQATEATLAGSVKSAIEAGNAAATAANLLPMFNLLNTKVDEGLTVAELQAAGLFTTAGGQAIFNKVDVDQNGMLTKSELIRAATEGTRGNIGGNSSLALVQAAVAEVRAAVAAVNTAVGGVAQAVGEVFQVASGIKVGTDIMGQQLVEVKFGNDVIGFWVDKTAHAIGLGTGGDSLQGLNRTAAEQLALLTPNYLLPLFPPGSGFPAGSRGLNIWSTPGGTGAGPGGGATIVAQLQNDMLLALNKIVWNTYQISRNTGGSVKTTGGGDPGNSFFFGTYAQGGVIPPYGLGLVSEHLNPTFLRAGAEPITVSPFSPMNDNFSTANVVPLPVSAGRSDAGYNFARMLSLMEAQSKEITELKEEIAAFRKENGVNTMNAARHIGEKVEETTEAVEGQTTKLAGEEQMNRRRAGSRR